MIIVTHMCVPEGEPMRQRYAHAMNGLREDNMLVIAAMLREGIVVMDTVGELGLEYDPEVFTWNEDGEPVFHLYGLRAMKRRRKFSCGDAAGYEAAVLSAKYGIPTECVSVAMSEDDQNHGIVVTPDGPYDPVARWKSGNPYRPRIPRVRQVVAPDCRIEDGRVQCDLPPRGCVNDRGVWVSGPRAGKREILVKKSGRFATTREGVVVPLCPPRGGGR